MSKMGNNKPINPIKFVEIKLKSSVFTIFIPDILYFTNINFTGYDFHINSNSTLIS